MDVRKTKRRFDTFHWMKNLSILVCFEALQSTAGLATRSRYFLKSNYPPIDLHLIFEKSVWKIKLEELDFLSISNLNFEGSVYQVWHKQKSSLSNYIFQKTKCRSFITFPRWPNPEIKIMIIFDLWLKIRFSSPIAKKLYLQQIFFAI